MEDVRIEFSETTGRQAVAMRDFRQGETIAHLPLRILNNPDMFSIEIRPLFHIDCTESPVGAMNHSCSPNAAVKDLKVIAWSCIKAGDPITLDYKRTETKLAAPFNCLCGSKNCRGRIE